MTNQPQGRGPAKFERRLGLAIIAVLSLVFVYVVSRRFDRSTSPPLSASNLAEPQLVPAPNGASERTNSRRSMPPADDAIASSPRPLLDNSVQSSRARHKADVDATRTSLSNRGLRPVTPDLSHPSFDESPSNEFGLQDYDTGNYELPTYDVRAASASRSEAHDQRVQSPRPLAPATLVEAAEPATTRNRKSAANQHDQLHPRPPESNHRILPNDSFWLISQREFGTGGYFRALFEHNRIRFPQPDRLPPGETVDVPTREQLHELYPTLCPPLDTPSIESPAMAEPNVRRTNEVPTRIHVVRDGETVFDIAKLRLGQMSRYVEIVELNREQLGDNLEDLEPGLELALPPH